MIDEDLPRPKPQRVTPHRLDAWDVEELREYVADLKAEIVRVEAALARKQGHRQAAEAFFRAPPG